MSQSTGSLPPIVVDIDGTLTDDSLVLEPRVGPALREWDAPVVIATGKALPYPIALCNYLGLDRNVIAENGGLSYVERADDLAIHGERTQAQAVAEEFVAAGYDLGWGAVDFPNRWRETEVVVAHQAPVEPLRHIAVAHNLEVVDTQYAYHVKSPSVTKGMALETVAAELDRDIDDFVAIGDSVNDVSTFERCGFAIAVGNADEHARAAADSVTEDCFGAGFLEALERIRDTWV